GACMGARAQPISTRMLLGAVACLGGTVIVLVDVVQILNWPMTATLSYDSFVLGFMNRWRIGDRRRLHAPRSTGANPGVDSAPSLTAARRRRMDRSLPPLAPRVAGMIPAKLLVATMADCPVSLLLPRFSPIPNVLPTS